MRDQRTSFSRSWLMPGGERVTQISGFATLIGGCVAGALGFP